MDHPKSERVRYSSPYCIIFFWSSSNVNVRRCEFFGHVHKFRSYSCIPRVTLLMKQYFNTVIKRGNFFKFCRSICWSWNCGRIAFWLFQDVSSFKTLPFLVSSNHRYLPIEICGSNIQDWLILVLLNWCKFQFCWWSIINYILSIIKKKIVLQTLSKNLDIGPGIVNFYNCCGNKMLWDNKDNGQLWS